MEEDVLELENRRRVFQFISKFQGAHLRQIQRAMELEVGVLKYHLDYMEKRGLLTSKKEKYRKRFFTKALGPKDKELLSILRQETLRRILMHVLLHPACTFKDLQSTFKISKSTLSFHLKKLREARLVLKVEKEVPKKGKRKVERYQVRKKDKVAEMLVTFRSSFLDDAVDNFVEIWLQL